MEEVKNIIDTSSLDIKESLPSIKPIILSQDQVPKKKNIFLTLILTIITLGIYSSHWYLKRSIEFNNLGTQKKMSKKTPLTLLVLNIIMISLIVIFPLTITEDIGTFYQYLTNFQKFILYGLGGIILLIFLSSLIVSFKSRAVINQALENKGTKARVSIFFTLIFGMYYLQYEINRIIADKEESPKVAPLIVISVIVLLIIISYVIFAFGLI